jgi:hypothetical protein
MDRKLCQGKPQDGKTRRAEMESPDLFIATESINFSYQIMQIENKSNFSEITQESLDQSWEALI